MTICSSGPCTHVGFPPGRSSPHLVAGGDGVLPDEPGHCDHRARREKCGGDRRTGGVCHPAPDSTTTSHLLTGALRAGLPRRQHSPRGHRRTEGRSAMTATRGALCSPRCDRSRPPSGLSASADSAPCRWQRRAGAVSPPQRDAAGLAPARRPAGVGVGVMAPRRLLGGASAPLPHLENSWRRHQGRQLLHLSFVRSKTAPSARARRSTPGAFALLGVDRHGSREQAAAGDRRRPAYPGDGPTGGASRRWDVSACVPLCVTDGLKEYGSALLLHFGYLGFLTVRPCDHRAGELPGCQGICLVSLGKCQIGAERFNAPGEQAHTVPVRVITHDLERVGPTGRQGRRPRGTQETDNAARPCRIVEVIGEQDVQASYGQSCT